MDMAEMLNLDLQLIESKEKQSLLTYHHSRPLSAVSFGEITQSPASENAKNESDKEDAEWFEEKYKWLEEQIGFYPVFVSAGRRNEDLRMTGYQNQWRKVLSRSREGNVHRPKGQIENNVLFSYTSLPDGAIFTDSNTWDEIIASSGLPNSKTTQSLFKPSWIKNDWITKANKDPHSVQVVVPKLDLRLANNIAVRNENTKIQLELMGFRNVVVSRLKLADR